MSFDPDVFADSVDDTITTMFVCDRPESRWDAMVSLEQVGTLTTPGESAISSRVPSPKVLLALGAIRCVEPNLVPDCYGIVAPAIRDDDDDESAGFFVHSVRHLQRTSKEWRQFGDRHHHVVALASTSFTAAGTRVAGTGYLWWSGESWEPTGISKEYCAALRDDGRDLPSLWMSLAVNMSAWRLSHWRARVHAGAVSLDIPTTLSGARALFRDRESTGSRRAALRHWVKEHWRRPALEAADPSFVRSHLRGKEHFRWRGLDFTLVPSFGDAALASRDVGKIQAAEIISTLSDTLGRLGKGAYQWRPGAS